MATAFSLALEAAPAPRPVVLVTGGSRGIGLALAQGFAARGYEPFLVARDVDQLRTAAAAIEAKVPLSIGFLPCDLTRIGAIDDILAELARTHRYVDILVNCASAAVSGDFAGNDASAARSVLKLNVNAATDLMLTCLAGMLLRRKGGVLNVASLAGVVPMPSLALYGATKSFLVALSRAVATETAGTGVTVSVLLPGPVNTEFITRNMNVDERRLAFLPGLSAAAVADTAIEAFLAGQTVITPGLLGCIGRLGAKLFPYQMLAPVIRNVFGTLSAPARARGDDMPGPAVMEARHPSTTPASKDAGAQAV